MLSLKKVHVAVFGSGLGHASRMLSVIEHLKKDKEVKFTFSSSNSGYELIKRLGYFCLNVPCIDAGWDENGLTFKKTARKLPINIFNFFSQISMEAFFMKKLKPNVVVSDSRLSAVIASKLLSLPTILVANQLQVLLPSFVSKKGFWLLEKIMGEIIGSLWALADEILIPDLPPPYTISEKNLTGLKTVSKRLKYVGFTCNEIKLSKERTNMVKKITKIDERKATVFAQISGPEPTKLRFAKQLIDSLKEISKYNIIVSLGIPNGSTNVKMIGNVCYFEWCPYKDELFKLADIVIMRAGHLSIANAIMNEKPMILIPIFKHSEQIENAKKVAKLGIGLVIDQKSLNKQSLQYAIDKIISTYKYKRKLINVKKIARNYDGVNGIASSILAKLK
jgi:UDP:flavonoid glycosyltransferase YjiC (YdhE family)